jgi:predicted GNAT family N-acyltransferase
MIKIIQLVDLLPIRNEVLRDGKLTPDECRFPTDEVEGVFHVGYFADDALVSVTSLSPQNYNGEKGNGYQLRGMATLAQYRGRGFGGELIDFAVNYLHDKQADYIWCNARKLAVKFYRDSGFGIISDEFEIKGIGPHYVMRRKL